RSSSPGGERLQPGARLEQPGLARALELVAEEGPRSLYDGTLASSLLELMDERGGLVTRDDLRRYEATWSEPVEVAYAGTRFLAREGLSGVHAAFSSVPPLDGLAPAEPALPLARAPDTGGAGSRTTTLSIADAAESRWRRAP